MSWRDPRHLERSREVSCHCLTFILYRSLLDMKKGGYIYILSTNNNVLLYIGVTNNLQRRLWEHRNKFFPGFTKTYNTQKLVYFESFATISEAIAREKQLKRWSRQKKDSLIERMNEDWTDLSDRA